MLKLGKKQTHPHFPNQVIANNVWA